MDDVICAICLKEFPKYAKGSHTTTVGSVCPKCVEKLQSTPHGSEGSVEGEV